MPHTRKLFMIALTLTGALVFGAQAREFRAADDQPEDYPTVQAQKRMGELLNKATDGKYTVKVYHSGQLGSEKDTIEQIKLGAIDFLRVNAGPLSPICSTVIVPVMPFLFKDKQHMRRVLDGPIGDEILAGLLQPGNDRPCFLR